MTGLSVGPQRQSNPPLGHQTDNGSSFLVWQHTRVSESTTWLLGSLLSPLLNLYVILLHILDHTREHSISTYLKMPSMSVL